LKRIKILKLKKSLQRIDGALREKKKVESDEDIDADADEEEED
jgi:hypothetical protein